MDTVVYTEQKTRENTPKIGKREICVKNGKELRFELFFLELNVLAYDRVILAESKFFLQFLWVTLLYVIKTSASSADQFQ